LLFRSFTVIIYNCHSIGSFLCCTNTNTNGIQLVPLHYQRFNWNSFAIVIDSCCINVFFNWGCCNNHSFHDMPLFSSQLKRIKLEYELNKRHLCMKGNTGDIDLLQKSLDLKKLELKHWYSVPIKLTWK